MLEELKCQKPNQPPWSFQAVEQKAHSSRCPDAVGRDQYCGLPCSSLSALLAMVNEIPNAEDDCFRHSVQWQT